MVRKVILQAFNPRGWKPESPGGCVYLDDVGDPSQVAPLLDQIATIASVTADGAYAWMPTYEVVASHCGDVRVIIPPHVTPVLSVEAQLTDPDPLMIEVCSDLRRQRPGPDRQCRTSRDQAEPAQHSCSGCMHFSGYNRKVMAVINLLH